MVQRWALADFNHFDRVAKVVVNLLALVSIQVANDMELSTSFIVIVTIISFVFTLRASIVTVGVAFSSV